MIIFFRGDLIWKSNDTLLMGPCSDYYTGTLPPLSMTGFIENGGCQFISPYNVHQGDMLYR